jgi:hypothetical protein
MSEELIRKLEEGASDPRLSLHFRLGMRAAIAMARQHYAENTSQAPVDLAELARSVVERWENNKYGLDEFEESIDSLKMALTSVKSSEIPFDKSQNEQETALGSGNTLAKDQEPKPDMAFNPSVTPRTTTPSPTYQNDSESGYPSVCTDCGFIMRGGPHLCWAAQPDHLGDVNDMIQSKEQPEQRIHHINLHGCSYCGPDGCKLMAEDFRGTPYSKEQPVGFMARTDHTWGDAEEVTLPEQKTMQPEERIEKALAILQKHIFDTPVLEGRGELIDAWKTLRYPERESRPLTERCKVEAIQLIEDTVFNRLSWNGGTVLDALLERFDIRRKP